MEIERHQPQSSPTSAVAINIDANTDTGAELHKPTILKSLPHLLLSIILLLIGGTGSTLILRVYFLHGGNRKWLSSFLQTAAFPFLLLPLFFSFLYQRLYKPSTAPKLFHLTPFFLLCSIGLGLLTGIDNLMFSYGVSYLPASTVSLLNSTFLAFTAFFAYLIVRQRFTASSINAVVLLICGAVVLGVHANGDRPEGQSMGKYFAGFALTLGAAMLYGLVLPLVELMYAKSKQIITFTLVLEMQLVISATASTFCAVGMAVNKDFQALPQHPHRGCCPQDLCCPSTDVKVEPISNPLSSHETYSLLETRGPKIYANSNKDNFDSVERWPVQDGIMYAGYSHD